MHFQFQPVGWRWIREDLPKSLRTVDKLISPPPGVKETMAETLTSHYIIVSMGLSFNVKGFSKKSIVGCHQFQVQ